MTGDESGARQARTPQDVETGVRAWQMVADDVISVVLICIASRLLSSCVFQIKVVRRTSLREPVIPSLFSTVRAIKTARLFDRTAIQSYNCARS